MDAIGFDPKLSVKKSDQVDCLKIEYFESSRNRKTWNSSVALLSLVVVVVYVILVVVVDTGNFPLKFGQNQ